MHSKSEKLLKLSQLDDEVHEGFILNDVEKTTCLILALIEHQEWG